MSPTLFNLGEGAMKRNMFLALVASVALMVVSAGSVAEGAPVSASVDPTISWRRDGQFVRRSAIAVR